MDSKIFERIGRVDMGLKFPGSVSVPFFEDRSDCRLFIDTWESILIEGVINYYS